MSYRFSISSCSSSTVGLLLVLASFHLCSSNQNYEDVLCMEEERQALLQFKHGLIDEAHRLASWVDEEKECCSWAGIVCDNFTRHIHTIHLRGLDGNCDMGYYTTKEYKEASKQPLRGDLSPALLHLKQLRHLDLSCNDFESTQVPTFIGSLENLRYLNLSSSRFGGIIPPQLGNLSKLQVLCLGSFNHRSELTNMINMRSLSSLRWLLHLDMSGVDLSKSINWLQVIDTLPSLVELHLSTCQIMHIHPNVFRLNTTTISLLDLSFNYLYSLLPRWIFSVTSLVSLDISECGFLASLPSSIDSFNNLTSLKVIHASGNDFMNSSLALNGLSSIGSQIILLDISSCGISSFVLDTLHNLTSLLRLDLSENQLTRTTPKLLGNLCNLKAIDLSWNDFRNISLTYLLASFFKCKSPSFELLFLQSLGLSGPIPYSIGGLSQLQALDISQNQLTGSLPDSLGQLSKLDHLDFSYNFLTGIVTEAHFAKLASLKYLSGSNNYLTLRPHLVNWTPSFQLQSLYLNSWGLGPQFPFWLHLQRDLIYLDISNTNISAPMPQSFWKSFPNLTYLDMSQNHIQGTLFSTPATLDVLDLNSNEFTGQLPDLSNSTEPLFLDLSNNFFVGSLHRFLCPYEEKWTEVLNLGNNHLSGVIPECWMKWSSLSFLSLENNELSGEIPKTLGFLYSLHSLNMRGNKLSGTLPASLINLSGLTYFQLGRNKLVGRIPTWIGREFLFLKSLDLGSNNFNGNIPQELCDLGTIHILDLSHNNLSGNIPRCFNNLSVLSGKDMSSMGTYMSYSIEGKDFFITETLVLKGREDIYKTILASVLMIDLSGNNLSGQIPSELMALRELMSLNLSRNELIGTIPKKIGDMKWLESLDLSLNMLSGELPMSLSSLSFLSKFNVSYNNLTGKVPLGTQLQSFDESSFRGNNLCGDPLTNGCVVKIPVIDEDDGEHDNDWGLIISMVSGFGVGFWIIMAPLVVSRPWRIAYFGLLTKLACNVMVATCFQGFEFC